MISQFKCNILIGYTLSSLRIMINLLGQKSLAANLLEHRCVGGFRHLDSGFIMPLTLEGLRDIQGVFAIVLLE
jgi:hypothetical protein